MASKFQSISDLYVEMIKEVVKDKDSWRAFLKTASTNYKLRFDEQILIFGQRPDATAVLEIEKWNKLFHRWVNKGAKGIAVFQYDNTGRQKLKHYFDVSDTHEGRNPIPVPIWKMKSEYTDGVIETLESVYGELDRKTVLSEAVINASENGVADNLDDYFFSLYDSRGNSLLEDLDKDNLYQIFKETVAESVSYLMLNRLGIETAMTDEYFAWVGHFNTRETLNALGYAARDIAAMGLREIAKTVQQLERENRTFDTHNEREYNVTKLDDRRDNDGNHLHNERRIEYTEHRDTGRKRDEFRSLGDTQKELSDERKESSVRQSSDIMHIEQSLDGNTNSSREYDGEPDNKDEGTGESNRGIEGERSDALDWVDEQYQELSEGNSDERDNRKLSIYNSQTEAKELPFFNWNNIPEALRTVLDEKELIEVEKIITEEGDDKEEHLRNLFMKKASLSTEKYSYVSYEDALLLIEGSLENPVSTNSLKWKHVLSHLEGMYLVGELHEEIPIADFTFPQGLIDEALTRGSGFVNGKFRIYEQFQKSLSLKENADFLKKEYGIGGVSEIKAGTGIGLDTSAAGIKLQRGYMPEAPVYLINWNDAAKRINELIKCDHYLSMPEAEEYSKWLLKNEETIQQPSIKNEEVSYEYHLKDKVFIGADEYEIVDIRDDKICLYDSNCPLINKELPIEIFEKRIKENPYNDHLIKKDVAENIYDNDKPNEEKIKDDYQDGITDITPKWEEKTISIPEPFNLVGEKKNYQLQENYDSYRTKRERFEDNIRAIELLKELTEEGRYASEEEQAVLSKYVGWGGLSESFDEDNASWQKEYQKLKSILDEDEYVSARESTLTSFYTPKVVIDAIYKVISQMGFVDGNILDPCCGIGNFMGVLPKEMENSRIYGVEIDKISGQIAKQLYQNNSITIKGYEDVSLSDSFFDIAVGNVPFGDFKVGDKRYDKNNWLIHDYFFGKTLDKVRPGGVIAFITSKGTMDKANSKVRKYIAQRAELLGAIRLPNDTFSKNAGTEVTADIIFLQKRDRCVEEEQSWIHLGTNEDGITMNQYFIEHSEMVLGEMKTISGRFGPETVCTAFEDSNLNELLESAISNIHGEIAEYERDEVDEEDRSIPADPEIRNFSYTINDGEIYFRENSRMYPVEVSETAKSRIKGLISIRESVRTLIEMQTENYEESEIKKEQDKLNLLYDNFTKKYGLITSRANSSAFSEDSSYYLLTALEVVDENGNLVRKADMFHKRTIKPNIPITHCDTASEALAISLGEKACIDILYMQKLTGKSENDLYNELQGIIFLNPKYERGLSNTKYLTNDEYLSGNVREKLNEAKELSQSDERYNINIKYLEKVQPKDLTASEISVRLGATWIPKEIIEDFIFELLDTPRYMRWNIKVHYSEYTGEWNIEGKNNDRGNVSAYSTYGTARANAYKIIEDTLNLKDVRIFDYEVDEDGKKKAILNKKETAIAQGKQEIIKNVFIDWIWKEAKRRELLTKMYNERFNSIRPREYDGSHIIFSGMNPEIKLREHQVNAIARILYGGNTLLAHAVGAGKTYEMVAAAMESKRLGLCNKSLFVVPNHLTEQWASEFLQLYPSANILVATRKDFQKNNRKKFCARIATGDYDAIIIGHTQLEKIPMSDERQRNMIEAELEEITQGIAELKKSRGERFSIKALEKSKKQIKLKLDKLNDQSQKDDVVTFEELGVDRLFIDESHYYKNLFLHTKMRNVGGIAQTEAQKSSDLFMKCRYLDEITGGKGIIFATGTPISNSMVELYTIQRYLQYDRLKSFNLQHFDCWASTFGETVTAIELAPEGTGYRAKTRFAKFYNLPELMAMFKEVADIQTADMLNLPVPKAEFHNVSVKPSEFQKSMVSELSERADRVRNKMVDSSVDNMLLITNDGRKLALDQRLINSNLPDFEGSKINACVDNIYNIWKDNYNDKLTQLVFCDLSTPKSDGSFNVYDDIKEKLIKKGVAEDEIEYIHNASTEMKKKILFGKVRSGDVRALLGSTQKMGAGTNVQDKLIALHDIDCPWRPSDVGRILRTFKIKKNVEVTDNGKIII